MTRLRVLHVSAYFAPAFTYGGPPRSIHGLCKALGSLGVAVDVMTTTANGDCEPLPAVVERPVVVDSVNVRYFPLARPSWLWATSGMRRALEHEIGEYDAVHIHGLWHLPAWYAARAARNARVPYLISPRGMLESQALARGRVRKAIALSLVERRNLRSAASLHATSPQERDTLAALGFGPPVLLAPNGVDIDTVTCPDPAPILRSYGLDPAGRFVLYLGRIHPIKRLDLLAAAASLLGTRDVSIVIAGPNERGHQQTVAPLFESSGVKTYWVGPVDDLQKAALLSSARALVLCSDSESFGLSALEAMAAATPVVTTTTCPWREVDAEGAGRCVPQTARAIAEALHGILSDDHAARAMGARGRSLVARRYTWRAAARMIADEYERLAERRRGSHVA